MRASRLMLLLLLWPILYSILFHLLDGTVGFGRMLSSNSEWFRMLIPSVTMWYGLFWPFVIALIAKHLISIEDNANTWQLWFSYRANRKQFLLGKLILLVILGAFILILFHVSFALIAYGRGLILDNPIQNEKFPAFALFIAWFAASVYSLLLYVIHLLMAIQIKQPTQYYLVSLLLLFGSALMAINEWAIFNPYTYTTISQGSLWSYLILGKGGRMFSALPLMFTITATLVGVGLVAILALTKRKAVL